MRELLSQVRYVAGPVQVRKYLLLLALMLLVAVLEAFGVGAILPFLAALSAPEKLLGDDRVVRVLGVLNLAPDPATLVPIMGGVVIGIFVLKGALTVLSNWVQARVLHGHRAWLSRTLFARYLTMPYSLYLNRNTAHVLHVISGVTAAFATAFMPALLLLISESMVCTAIIVLLLFVSPMVTIAAVTFLGLIGGGYVLFAKQRLSFIGRTQNEATKALNKNVIEGLGSIKETRILGAEAYFLRRFDRLARMYMRQSVRLNVMNNSPRPIAEALFVTIILGIVIALTLTTRDIQGQLPVLLLFGVAFLRLLPSFNRIVYAYGIVRVQHVALDILFGELREIAQSGAQSNVEGKRRATLPGALNFKEALEVVDLSFTYPGQATPALDRVSIKVRKGETIGLVGRSGSGKTTMVDVILGLLQPQTGDIRVDGTSILRCHDAWQGAIGYIPQSIYLTDDTIRRNIAFGVEDHDIDPKRLSAALNAAQLSAFVESLPAGLDTVVGDRGVRLSGGQRQRVGIARALYHDPEILILDEATSALDVETESAVAGALTAVLSNKTLIVIAHRLSTVRDCDRLYVIESGRVIDSGTYDELRERNRWFRQINDLLE
jgi:ATP-binding cassette subfamily C protein